MRHDRHGKQAESQGAGMPLPLWEAAAGSGGHPEAVRQAPRPPGYERYRTHSRKRLKSQELLDASLRTQQARRLCVSREYYLVYRILCLQSAA